MKTLTCSGFSRMTKMVTLALLAAVACGCETTEEFDRANYPGTESAIDAAERGRISAETAQINLENVQRVRCNRENRNRERRGEAPRWCR